MLGLHNRASVLYHHSLGVAQVWYISSTHERSSFRCAWKRRGHCSPAHRPLLGTLFVCNCTLRERCCVRYPESEVVRYSGAAIVLYIILEISVGTYGSVRYSVEVRYSECPLIESTVLCQAFGHCC